MIFPQTTRSGKSLDAEAQRWYNVAVMCRESLHSLKRNAGTGEIMYLKTGPIVRVSTEKTTTFYYLSKECRDLLRDNGLLPWWDF